MFNRHGDYTYHAENQSEVKMSKLQLQMMRRDIERCSNRLRVNYDKNTDYSQIKSFVLLDIINNLESVMTGLDSTTDET